MVVPPFHTPKWSFLVGKPIVVGYHCRKHSYEPLHHWALLRHFVMCLEEKNLKPIIICPVFNHKNRHHPSHAAPLFLPFLLNELVSLSILESWHFLHPLGGFLLLWPAVFKRTFQPHIRSNWRCKKRCQADFKKCVVGDKLTWWLFDCMLSDSVTRWKCVLIEVLSDYPLVTICLGL